MPKSWQRDLTGRSPLSLESVGTREVIFEVNSETLDNIV